MLPLWSRVDPWVMTIKVYSAFPKAPALLEPHQQIVSYPGHSLGGESYPTAEVQSEYPTAPADWAIYLWLLSYNSECEVRGRQAPFFESLVWIDLGLNPGLPGHWRTLYKFSQWPAALKFIQWFFVCVRVSLCSEKIYLNLKHIRSYKWNHIV